jgi:TetR/AcrR family transcriptional regulator, lmrAB and yxaGH operons repressor
MAIGQTDSKAKMVVATLDLLRGSGLSGAGINNIVAASGAPKGSVYHFFPGGKHELVAAALREAEQTIGDGFRRIFGQRSSISEKVRSLFEGTAERLAASNFLKGCPIAAVTLDIGSSSEDLRAICSSVFENWRKIIASGLDDVPPSRRSDVAQLILVSFEGALVLSRAHAAPHPLTETGALLATTFAQAYKQPTGCDQQPKRANASRRFRRPRT